MTGFLLSNLALAFASWRAAESFDDLDDPWARAATGLLAFQLGAAGLALLLALAGLLTPTAQMAGAGVLAVASLGLKRAGPAASAPLERADHLGVAVLVATLAVWALGPPLTGTELTYDDATYHAAIPAWMLTEGHFAIAPFTYQAYYPLQTELVSLWFMIPTHDLTHAGLGPLLHALLFATAGTALARHLGASTGSGAAFVATLLVSRRTLQGLHSTSAPDLCATANLVTALLFAMTVPGRLGALLFGVAAGAALSTKITTASALVLAAAWYAWQNRAQPARIGIAAGVGIALGCGWYVRNLVLTGNPLFPAALGPFEGPLDPETQYVSSLRPFLDPAHPRMVWNVVKTRLNWPTVLGIGALVGLGASIVAGWRRRRADLVLVGIIGILGILLLPRQPFSGTVNRPDQPLHALIRFVMPAVAMGLVGFAGAVGPSARGVFAGVALWALTLFGSTDLVRTRDFAALGLGITVAAGLGALAVRGRAPGRRTVAALVLGVLLVLAARTPAKRRATILQLPRISLSAGNQVELFVAINRLKRGSVLAQVADVPVSNDHSVRALGMSLQHRYLAIDLDGTPLRPLHERWRDEPAGWWWRWGRAQSDGFLENLAQTDVDFLIVSTCNEVDTWPPVREKLLEHPERRIHASDCGEIWRAR